jgi:heat shock protein HslJ
MKLTAKLTVLLAAAAALAISSCATSEGAAAAGPAATADVGEFAAVMGREWILAEIRTATETVALDREFHAETFGDIFTIAFESDMARGKGMPNNFFGPYTLGPNNGIDFRPMATTLMAAFMEPEEINEHEFMQFLDRAAVWNLSGGNLELRTSDESGAPVVLVFVPL